MFDMSVAVKSLGLETMPSFVEKSNQFIGVESGWRMDGWMEGNYNISSSALFALISQYSRN